MILVTGGAGFIGSVLVRKLNEFGHHNILIVDRLRDSIKWKNLIKSKFISYIHADELFFDINKHYLDKIKFIFHIGACSATTEMDVDYLFENNVEYSKKLFNLAFEKDIPFIYASSAATYGDGELGYSDKEIEMHKLIPLNPYGFTKKIFDDWVLSNEDKPKTWIGLKFFNVYGPNEYHKGEMRSLIHKAFEQIKETGKVKLFRSHRTDFEDGKQLRDFVYVKDVVTAMVLMMENISDIKNGIYNLGTGKARSFDDLVSEVFKAMGKEVSIQYIDMPLEIRDQYQYFTEADMTRFHSNLSNFSFSTLEQGVSDYVKNYLLGKNQNY